MAQITLRTPTVGSSVVAGIQFMDGQASAELGPNQRGYFELTGATIVDSVGLARRAKKPRRSRAKQPVKAASAVAPTVVETLNDESAVSIEDAGEN